MANIIKIKRGSGVPASGQLAGYELGWDYTNNSLYVGVEGSNPIKITDAFGGYLSINKTTGKIYAATSAMEIGGAVDFNSTLTVDGATLINNTLTATGLASLNGGINVNSGNFTVSTGGNIHTAGTLTVDGGTTLGDSADDVNTIRGIVSIGDLNRTTSVLGALEVDQAVGIDGNLRIGTAGTSKLTVNSSTGNLYTTGTLDVDGATNINNTLSVDGAVTLGSSLGVSGTTTLTGLIVNAASTFNDDVLISAGTLTVDGASYLNADLTVTGLSSLDGGVDVNGKVTISSATGDIATAGDVTANNVTVNGNLVVHGTTTTVESTTVTISDPIFTLGQTLAVSDGKDRGIEFKYGSTGTPLTGFFGLDESTGRFTYIPNAINTAEVFSGTVGDFEVGKIFQGGINVSDKWNAAAVATANMVTGTHYDLLQADANGIFTPTKTIAAESGITIDCGTY
jgi:hypothetical protein